MFAVLLLQLFGICGILWRYVARAGLPLFRMLDRADLDRLAAAAKLDPRTVRTAYEGRRVRPATLARIATSAMSLGIAPPDPAVLGRTRERQTLARLDAEPVAPDGRETKEASVHGSNLILKGGGNLKPSTTAYLELPISVQHAWDAYPIVDQALEELEHGQFLNAAMLADAVRTDDRALGCISTRVNAIFGLPMEFKWQGQGDEHASALPGSPTGGDGAQASGPTEHVGESEDSPEVIRLKQRVCKLVEDNWERMMPTAAAKEVTTWGILLNAGIGELVWAWEKAQDVVFDEDDLASTTGRDLVFPTLKSWHPQFLYWRWDTRSYWLIHQGGQVELSPGDGRWVQFSPSGHNHGWLYGLIRAIAKLWIDRLFLWRDWARASEKFALGVVKAFVPSEASAADKAAFIAAISNMASESTVQLPRYAEGKPGFDLDMLKTSDSAVNTDAFFETRLKRIDTSIAVCILGQNLTTDISGTAGSRAAAQVHENVRADFLKADVEILQQVISTMVLTPFVRYNFEAEARFLGMDWRRLVPEVTFKVDPPEDASKEAEAVGKIADAVPKLAGTEADIHALLDKHGIPVLDEKRSPPRPPPTPGQQPERPRGPGGTVGVSPPGLGDPPKPSGNADQPLEVQARRGPPLSKPGQRKGRVLSDDLKDSAKEAAARALDPRRQELLRICETSKTYDEMRERVKRLYLDAKPSELRSIVEKCLAAAQLIGQLSARIDHRHV